MEDWIEAKMTIKKISVSNFKSFGDLDIELGNLNILIGANASGKSNFLQIFKFLRDITNHGLNNAISLQGGAEYLRNINLGSTKNFSLKFVYTSNTKWNIGKEKAKKTIEAETYEAIYEFVLEFNKKGKGFKVSEDKLTQKLRFYELERQEWNIETEKELGLGEIILANTDGKLRANFNLPKTIPIAPEDIFPLFSGANLPSILSTRDLPPKTLFLESPFFFFINPFEKFFENISIYDIDPKQSKRGIPITGKTELEEDGRNLAIVLENILEDKDKRRKFSNLIQYLLPFIDDLRVEKFADKSLIFTLQETFTQNHYLPAWFISDGTVNITALIVVLYFERKPLIILEEPEKNIHPFLISKVVSMMEEASQKKQIIVTTHNPEIIKHINIENILLISRDREGFSTIIKPSQKEEVKIFLENEIGIEELYIQDLLQV